MNTIILFIGSLIYSFVHSELFIKIQTMLGAIDYCKDFTFTTEYEFCLLKSLNLSLSLLENYGNILFPSVI